MYGHEAILQRKMAARAIAQGKGRARSGGHERKREISRNECRGTDARVTWEHSLMIELGSLKVRGRERKRRKEGMVGGGWCERWW
jgi:hypothetical protein